MSVVLLRFDLAVNHVMAYPVIELCEFDIILLEWLPRGPL